MDNQSIAKLIESVKVLAIESIKSGMSATEVAGQIAQTFGGGESGTKIARLVMANIALDFGKTSETKAYLESSGLI